MAGFTFHIPYLIRMFTLLLYRWHTSGGFSYFDNFTVIYATISSVVSVVVSVLGSGVGSTGAIQVPLS